MTQLELQPTTLVVKSLEEFRAAVERADQLAKADGQWVIAKKGEFAITACEQVTGQRACWELSLRWN